MASTHHYGTTVVWTGNRGGGGQFAEVVLRPTVTVAEGGMIDAAQALHDAAHATCFIARSVSFPVRHQPKSQTEPGVTKPPHLGATATATSRAIIWLRRSRVDA
jgi:hypothetical protein